MIRLVRSFSRDQRRLILAGYVLVVLALGFVGWRQTAPEMPPWSALYHTIQLFFVDFQTKYQPTPLLEVARFAAPVATATAVVAVAARLIAGHRTLTRAAKLRDHWLLVGTGAEVVELAEKLRGEGANVVVVGDLDTARTAKLKNARILHLAEADGADLAQVIRGASRVLVIEDDDDDATATARTVMSAAAGIPTTILFTDPDLAAQWERSAEKGDAVARPTHVANAALRAQPPYPTGAVVPPPVVVGSGPGAIELARMIAVGWQDAGEARTVYCVGADESWVEEARLETQGRAELVFVRMPARAGAARKAVAQILSGWSLPKRAERYSYCGPRIYVSYESEAQTLPIASALADAARVAGPGLFEPAIEAGGEFVSDATVVAIIDDDDVWSEHRLPENLHVVPARRILTEPERYRESVDTHLTRELVAEAGRWPGDEQTALGDPIGDEAGVKERSARVAAVARPALEAAGVEIHRGSVGETAAVVLTPDKLVGVAQRLADALGVPFGATATTGDGSEVRVDVGRLRLLELAARLPVLLARTGVTPVRADGDEVFSAAEIETLAQMAHGEYKETALATDNATGSANADAAWTALSETDRLSNVAQILDIPVKLAVLGLGMRRLEPSEVVPLHEFTADEVELLAELEHRRWAHFQVRNGRPGHDWNTPWAQLPDKTKQYDRDPVIAIPAALASVGWTIVPPPRD